MNIAFIVYDENDIRYNFEMPFITYLQNNGHTVIAITSSSNFDYTGYDMVIHSYGAGGIDGKNSMKWCRDNGKPCIYMADADLGTLFFSGFGNTSSYSNVTIVSSHPVTSRYSEGQYLGVYGSSNTMIFTNTGNLLENAISLAESSSGNPVMVARTYNGTNHVFFGMVEGDVINDDGWVLFGNAVNWCLNIQKPLAEFTSIIPPESPAESGTELQWEMSVKNSGTDGKIFIKVKPSNGAEEEIFRNIVPSSNVIDNSYVVTMPNEDFSLTISIGHEE